MHTRRIVVDLHFIISEVMQVHAQTQTQTITVIANRKQQRKNIIAKAAAARSASALEQNYLSDGRNIDLT